MLPISLKLEICPTVLVGAGKAGSDSTSWAVRNADLLRAPGDRDAWEVRTTASCRRGGPAGGAHRR